MSQRNDSEKKLIGSLVKLYKKVPEPRVPGRCKHKLIDILVLITCAFLCDITEWEEIELYGNEKINWLKKYLELPNGIPSHDTLLRVFKIIDAHTFEIIFFEWIQSVVKLKKEQVIAFDGKRVSGTYPWPASAKGKTLSLLNIWAVEDGIALGQMGIKTTGFSEMTGIKECLKYLNLEGMLVTADAACGFPTVAKSVRDKKADYLLSVKRTNRLQAKELDEIFKEPKLKTHKNKCVSRGREELRVCGVLTDTDVIKKFGERFNWPDLNTIGVVHYYRKEKDRRTVKQELQKNGAWKWSQNTGEYRELKEKKFYLSSRKLLPKELLEKARSHWHIENKLNWQLDVTFREDANRTRDKVAAQNMSMIRKICLNLLKAETSVKSSLKWKKKKCVLNEAYLEKVLFN